MRPLRWQIVRQHWRMLLPAIALQACITGAVSGDDKAVDARVRELIADLGSHNPSVRWRAAEALARLGRSARKAVPALIKVLDSDEHSSNQEGAALALGAIGPEAAGQTVPPLVKVFGRAGTA